MRAEGGRAFLAGALDEVCWLFNLRGTDVPCCPVVQAYALVHVPPTDEEPPSATLFINEAKLTQEVSAFLAEAGVQSAPYEAVEAAVVDLAASGQPVMLDASNLNYGLRIAAGDRALLRPSPITLPKACKNAAELDGMLEAHLIDGTVRNARCHAARGHAARGHAARGHAAP